MKLIIKKGMMMAAVALSISSCKKDTPLMFNEPTSVYVESNVDSTVYTFATSPVEVVSDTINVNYRIIGNSAPTDRQISLVVRDGATAKMGYHYTVGPAVVKANEFSTVVPIYVYRKAGLKDSTVTAILDIVENADFKTGYPKRLRYKVTISDILLKPTIWDGAWASYFGTYSEVKFRFLLRVTGRTDWNSYPFPQDSRYLSQRAKLALLEYNQANGDLIDEFGQAVTFP